MQTRKSVFVFVDDDNNKNNNNRIGNGFFFGKDMSLSQHRRT